MQTIFRSLIIVGLTLIIGQIFAQNYTLSGKITDTETGEALTNAHIFLKEFNKTTSNTEGKFDFQDIKDGKYQLEVTHLGYEKYLLPVEITADKTLHIQLAPKTYQSETVVITATRTKRNTEDIPGTIDVISRRQIEQIPAQKLDDILQYTAGLNVTRSSGIYTIRPVVTLRGLSGNEQGRTLVMIDGVPINKGDTGGANWNRINKDDIERIEIYKGPGSSLYGNSAMGGVINIITRKPKKKFEGNGSISYGTYNTKTASIYAGSKYSKNGYFKIAGFLTNSDGYNPIPDSLRENPDYSTKKFLEEYGINLKTGYHFTDLFNADIQYEHYRDKRGEGEKIIAPDGEYRHFNTDFMRARIYGSTKSFTYNFLAFYQKENYLRVDERMRGENYSRFDVDSDREDMGIMLFMSKNLGDKNLITLGSEFKNSSVEGGDYYQTSPDSVVNKGKMNNFAIYLQDEISLVNNKLRIVAGIRFDHVKFYDGFYSNTDGSWALIIPELDDHNWNAISPRLAISYQPGKNSKIYASWSHGFRASILDDLCRSGWMWVGPKIANPELGPEKLDNYEIGGKFKVEDILIITPAIFYSNGNDFLYYVQTKDSLWGKRPVYQRQNITRVHIYGAELEIKYHLNENIQVFSNYTHNHSTIKAFKDNPELEDKLLKYTPDNQFKCGFFWHNKIVNTNVNYIYKSKQFIDDENIQEIKAYGIVNLNLSRNIGSHINAALNIQNLFDNKHMENYLYMAPGRLFTGTVSFTL